MPEVMGVRFREAGKIYYFDPTGFEDLQVGTYVVVDTARGEEVGQIAIALKQVADDKVVGQLKGILRQAAPWDLLRMQHFRDLEEQAFLLRQITTPDLSEVLEEEIIVEDRLSNNCRVVYVEFDDGEFTHEGRAKFRAGRSGWAFGGKIVLLDEKEKPYSVVINRLNRMITLQEGDVRLLEPKFKDELVF